MSSGARRISEHNQKQVIIAAIFLYTFVYEDFPDIPLWVRPCLSDKHDCQALRIVTGTEAGCPCAQSTANVCNHSIHAEHDKFPQPGTVMNVRETQSG